MMTIGDVDSLGNYDNHANHAVDHDGRSAATDPDKDGDYCLHCWLSSPIFFVVRRLSHNG